MFNPEEVRRFGAVIQTLIGGGDLTRSQAYAAFKAVLLNEQPELQQGASLAALTAKGETPDEIAGAWQAIDELDTVHTRTEFDGPLVENSGTGMDRLKSFNASSAAAIVAAAGSVRLGRHGARALTSACGTVDILEAVGVDVECDVGVVETSLRQTHLGLFNGMSSRVHPRALGRILSQIRFGSTLNIAASLANPCRPTHAVRGVYAPELLEKVAAVMRQIGIRRGMLVHGYDQDRRPGLDEVSILGETDVLEYEGDGPCRREVLRPEDLGLRRAEYRQIAPAASLDAEARRFVSVLAGRGPQACADFTVLNAAAILRLAGKVRDWAGGVARAQELLASGAALRQLRAWVEIQQSPGGAGPARLAKISAQI